MGRPKRTYIGGRVYHALNLANAQMILFESDADYEAFETVGRRKCTYPLLCGPVVPANPGQRAARVSKRFAGEGWSLACQRFLSAAAPTISRRPSVLARPGQPVSV